MASTKPKLTRVKASRVMQTQLSDSAMIGKNLFQDVLGETNNNPNPGSAAIDSLPNRTQVPVGFQVAETQIPPEVQPGEWFKAIISYKPKGELYPVLETSKLQCPPWSTPLQQVIVARPSGGAWQVVRPLQQVDLETILMQEQVKSRKLESFANTQKNRTLYEQEAGYHTASPHQNSQGVRYEVFRSKLVSAMVAANTAGRGIARSYKYYKFYLGGIREVFQDVSFGWNRSHSAARKIYSQTAAARVVRAAIRVEHCGLYRQGILRRRTGKLETGEDLFDLLQSGGHKRVFTYVITDDAMYCSETGVEFSKNYMSKHAVHAKAATSVRYAGEFWIAQVRDEKVLVLDNNSGTFAPLGNGLRFAVQVWRNNLRDLNIRGVAIDDPRHAVLKNAIS